jgi:hypothetical protein
MNDLRRLAVVRAAHTAIYVVMACSVLAVDYAAISGRRGPWLWAALALVGVEVVVFAGAGMKCPLTALVVKYGGTPGEISDTYFPERFTRYTLRIFGPLIAVGMLLLAVRWAGAVLRNLG